ncbi:MAG: hypothetical protein DWQ19_11430 [Crenarchaeota archaeon]|nr:MAG: hypothetical protein DWQ19_11430 [Thermoproteota archaeon]
MKERQYSFISLSKIHDSTKWEISWITEFWEGSVLNYASREVIAQESVLENAMGKAFFSAALLKINLDIENNVCEQVTKQLQTGSVAICW